MLINYFWRECNQNCHTIENVYNTDNVTFDGDETSKNRLPSSENNPTRFRHTTRNATVEQCSRINRVELLDIDAGNRFFRSTGDDTLYNGYPLHEQSVGNQ